MRILSIVLLNYVSCSFSNRKRKIRRDVTTATSTTTPVFTVTATIPTTVSIGTTATQAPLRKVEVDSSLRIYGDFTFTTDMLDNTSADHLGIKTQVYQFVSKIFKTIIDTYGYTLTIEITISAPPSGRRKRDISDSPVVDVTATLTGEDDGTTTSTVLDNLISTGTTDAYNNYDSSEFGDLIDTSLSPIVSNSEVVYALTGVGCWTCHAGSYVDCAKTGTFEICDEKNSEPPVCFVELRENRQNIISISTGCTHYKACDDLKSQNRANNNPDHDQCRPDFRYQYSSARLDYKVYQISSSLVTYYI